jgi:hypothetical protein
MLWLCNIGNLLLALGMFVDKPVLMRIAIIWTIPGLAIWLVYVVFAWGVFLSSTMAHLGGLIVGLVALGKVGMDRRSWLYAFGWYLLMQFASRFFTAADLNVNLSHAIQPGWERTFGAYWEFWLTLTALTALVLWGLGLVLWRLRPARIVKSIRTD